MKGLQHIFIAPVAILLWLAALILGAALILRDMVLHAIKNPDS